MTELRALFEQDFGPLHVISDLPLRIPGGAVHVVSFCAILDHEANSVFLSCYLPDQINPDVVIRAAWRDRSMVDIARELAIEHRHMHTQPATSSVELTFTGRVWIYFDGLIDEILATTLRDEARLGGVSLFVRDRRYVEARMAMSTPEAFICYDSADRETVAVPLTRALRLVGVSAWLDTEQIMPGDSLRERIEQGIQDAKRFIILVTPNFLGNRRWAADEYSAAFALEKSKALRLIVPVWCGVTANDIAQHTPFLVDRSAVIWNGNATEVARRLATAFR